MNQRTSSATGSGGTLQSLVTYDFPEGPNNWVQWRAKDAAGNGPTESQLFRIPVDTRGVSFSEFYPPPTLAQTNATAMVFISISDLAGSGVNINSIQVATQPQGNGAYGEWFAPQVTIVSQSTPFSNVVPSGPEKVRISVSIDGLRDGDNNRIKFRARDMAGNNYTESKAYVVRVGSASIASDGQGAGNLITDYWWLIVLTIIILILLIVTVLNWKRDSPPKNKEGQQWLPIQQSPPLQSGPDGPPTLPPLRPQ